MLPAVIKVAFADPSPAKFMSANAITMKAKERRGPSRAGQIGNGVSNRGGREGDSSYGANDIRPDVRSGADSRDRSDEGRADGNDASARGGDR